MLMLFICLAAIWLPFFFVQEYKINQKDENTLIFIRNFEDYCPLK